MTKFELKSVEGFWFLPKGFACQEHGQQGKRWERHGLLPLELPSAYAQVRPDHNEMAVIVYEEANSMILARPMVYLTVPAKMQKGSFVLLG